MEQERKVGVDLGVFVLRMNLSSESETELEQKPENRGEHVINQELMNETKSVTNNETEVDNCTLSEAVAKWRVSLRGRKRKIKWGWRHEIAIASAVREGVKHGLYGVTSARNASCSFNKHREFWVEVNKKLEEETGLCVPAPCVNKKFDNMMRKYFKRNRMKRLKQHDFDVFGILEGLFDSGGEQRSGLGDTLQSDVEAVIPEGPNAREDKMISPEKKSINCTSPPHPTRCNLRAQEKKLNVLKLNKGLSGVKIARHRVDKSLALVRTRRPVANLNKRKRHGIYSNARLSIQKYHTSDEEGPSIKRAKWSRTDEILIVSAIRDGINCGLNGISSGKEVTCFKMHKRFWEKVAKKLQKETGKSASTFQFYQKFRNLKSTLFAKKQCGILNQHDEQVLSILEQVDSNDKEQDSGLDESADSDAEDVFIDDEMNTKRKAVRSTSTPNDSGLSCGYQLRNRTERRKDGLKMNKIAPNEKAQLRRRLSAKRYPVKDGKGVQGQKLDLDNDIDGNYNANCSSALHSSKRVRRAVKRGWEPKDEIAIASAVRDGINCGMTGVKSVRDAMSFRTHEGFWTQLNKKLQEETGKHTSAYELFQAFRSSKYRYLTSKRCLIQELNEHDEELFSILEQVFRKDKKQRQSLSETHDSDVNGQLSSAQPSLGNGGQEDQHRESRTCEHGNAVDQDNQTCMDLPCQMPLSNDRASSEMQVQHLEDDESCPNVFKEINLHSSTRGASCQGGETEATLLTPVVHSTEKLSGLKDTKVIQGKCSRLNEQAEPSLEHTNVADEEKQICKELPCQMPPYPDGTGGAETQSPKQDSRPDVLNGSNLPLPSMSPGYPLNQGGETELAFSAPVTHDGKNLDGLDTEGKCKKINNGTHTLRNKTSPECVLNLQDDSIPEGNKEHWNGNNLTGSRSLEEESSQETDYSEIVKRLERKSRKLQLLQELYKIEQLDIEDKIRQAKLKVSYGNP